MMADRAAHTAGACACAYKSVPLHLQTHLTHGPVSSFISLLPSVPSASAPIWIRVLCASTTRPRRHRPTATLCRLPQHQEDQVSVSHNKGLFEGDWVRFL